MALIQLESVDVAIQALIVSIKLFVYDFIRSCITVN